MNRLIGLAVDDAAGLLEGRSVRIIYNHPPRGPINGVARIVRVADDGDTVTLTACVFPMLNEKADTIIDN